METQDPDQEWKKEAPKLADLPRKELFEVPEGYFEGLTGRILQKVEADTKPTAPQKAPFRWQTLLIPVASAAAVVLLVISIWSGPVAPSTGGRALAGHRMELEDLSDEELMNLIQAEGLTNQDMIAMLETQPGVNENHTPAQPEEELKEVPVDELEQYLNDIPLDELENLL